MLLQVRTLFLQWIPWVLRMARPGEKITRKTIMMQNKMKELDLKEKSSKSLLANVLDMDDDFVPSSSLPHSHLHHQHSTAANQTQTGQQKNGGFIRLFEQFYDVITSILLYISSFISHLKQGKYLYFIFSRPTEIPPNFLHFSLIVFSSNRVPPSPILPAALLNTINKIERKIQ